MVYNPKMRSGQKRWADPYHPQQVHNRAIQDEELKKQYGPELDEQKSIMGDLKHLSDSHAAHGAALADVDAISKEQTVNLKAAMLDPRYTGQRPEGRDPAYRAWVDSEWKRIYPDKAVDDRDLNPSSGAPIHSRMGSGVVADE